MPRERVVALVDMDCFYVQVEQRLNPSLLGKPCAVVQYKEWKGGGIIAVSYEARKFGVTRRMRGDEAKEQCPEIILARVPELRGKADLTRYRDACAEVMDVLQNFADVCERASVDEAYLDLTERVHKELENITLKELVDKTMACSHIIGYTDQPVTDSHDTRGQWLAALSDENVKCLAMGAVIIQQARAAVKEKTGFTCSAGIAHNKVLAKIAGGSHKPNQQTLLPQHSVAKFFETIPIRKVRFFGGKFGQNVINSLNVEYMSELTKYSLEELRRYFGEKSGSWLYDVCRGREYEVVRPRQLSKSCGCGKNFTGKSRLISKEKVTHWILQLASELGDRLKIEEEKNNRTAKLVSVGLTTEGNTSGVRSFPLRNLDPKSICENAMQVLKTFNSGTGDKWHPGVTSLSLQASKFEDISKASATSSIASFFARQNNVAAANSKQLNLKTEEPQKDNMKILSTASTESTDTLNTNDDSQNIKKDSEMKTPCDNSFDPPSHIVETKSSYVRPSDIGNEIEQFGGVSKTPERSKRTLNGIEKYTISKNVDEKNTGNINIPGNTISDLKNSADDTRCSKCGQKVEESKIAEHNDYHFALNLQKQGEIKFNTSQTVEPPKKRQKGTISNFFVPKAR